MPVHASGETPVSCTLIVLSDPPPFRAWRAPELDTLILQP
jgi:hypothetical protein